MITLPTQANLLFIKNMMGNDFPDFVKVADFNNKESQSAVFFEGCQAILKNDKGNLKKVATRCIEKGVMDELKKFAKHYGDKKDNIDNYAYVTKKGNYLPLHNSQLVKRADKYFNKNYVNYDINYRPNIAKKIMTKAAMLGIRQCSKPTLIYSCIGNKELEKAVADTFIFKNASYKLLKRAESVKDPKSKSIYATVGKMLSQEPDFNQVIKLAHIIEKIDYQNKLSYKTVKQASTELRDNFMHPINELFSSLNKQANSDQKIKLVNKTITTKDIENIPDEKFLQVMGFEKTTDKTILDTLPLPDKALLEKIARYE